MSWKKKFNTVKIKPRENEKQDSRTSVDFNRNQSWLPEFYQGSYDRVARYMQYDHMDYDIDVNMALDTISEFSTLTDDESQVPFELTVSEDITSGDQQVLNELLKKWCRINDWNSRIFDLFRNTIKYGDQVFIRDPETFELLWVDVYNITKVLVNEEEGKTPEYYFVTNLAINMEQLVASDQSQFLMNIPLAGGSRQSKTFTNNQSMYSFNDDSFGSYGLDDNKETPVDATHIVHVSRTNGMDNLWPFGRSVLDSIFKPYKQKELLEDAIIIYRVQRSPERLLFKIDTGTMPPNKADKYVEQVATRLRQKRVPIVDTDKGETIMDTTYNPLGMTEDFFFAQGADGRGSTVESLPGGESTGSIEDLKFFTSRMIRGLRVPIAYMSYLSEDGQTHQYNDGKVGTAYMEEFKFAKYCERLQREIIRTLNREFKLFVKNSDVEVNSSDFDIMFRKPQSFSDYRQIELDTAQMAVFQSVADIEFLSKRFMMKRFMGLTEEEIKENERMWKEENKFKVDFQNSDLPDADINVPSDDDIEETEEDEFDMDIGGDIEDEDDTSVDLDDTDENTE